MPDAAVVAEERADRAGCEWWYEGVSGLDPAWCLEFVDPKQTTRRVMESLLTLSNGYLGTRGACEEPARGAEPGVLVAGVYNESGDRTELLPGPRWTTVHLGDGVPTHDHRILDLRGGALWRHAVFPDREIHSVRFVSLFRPDVVAMRLHCTGAVGGPALDVEDLPGANATVWRDRHLGSTLAEDGGGIAAACQQTIAERATGTTLERIVAFVGAADRPVSMHEPFQALRVAESIGFERLWLEHRDAWEARWTRASVSIDGDPDAQLALRFALFHLLSAAPTSGEAGVGARGLTGHAYAGHVFWDADIFMLPALAACLPQAARSMVEYRVGRLPAAVERAARRGLAGAAFPWESGRTGDDVTPRGYMDEETGEFRPFLTGMYEDHISADVAWAIIHYVDWSGDEDLLRGAGGAVIVETARYWASRVTWDERGRAHILDVIGPDEYHERVDDNAYTNVMARWNLRAAASAPVVGPTDDERAGWRAIADHLVDGYQPETGLYEQFTGFGDLEPLFIGDVAEVPVAADLLLGRPRVQRSQVVKQPDVLMLHHLVPDEVAPGSLDPNLAYYLPRTAHGSSLSPAMMALLLARAGRVEDAVELFRLGGRIDTDDLTGTTAGGLHLATMGGLWQAAAHGFAGVRPRRDALEIDPHLPAAWARFELAFTYRGTPVRLEIDATAFSVHCEHPITVRLDGGDHQIAPPVVRFVRRHGTWEAPT